MWVTLFKMNKITILYEADCGFCNVCRRFVEKRDSNGTFTFIDIYSEEASNLIRKTGHPQSREYDSIVVTNGQNLYLHKYPACLYIAKRLRQPWPLLALLLRIIPNFIGNWGYDLVAHNRKHLSKVVPK
ncbi:MAG: putative DCC family thiol-disulfide oxidoreductase YuxK [Candidatus Azotimanducaceae bacterium]